MFTQHRLLSAPFNRAGSSTISAGLRPARFTASPRRLQLRLRAPRTHMAVGGISGRGWREARAELPARERWDAELLQSLLSLCLRGSLHRQLSVQHGTAPLSSPNSPSSLHKLELSGRIREINPGGAPPSPPVSSTYLCARIWQGNHSSPN